LILSLFDDSIGKWFGSNGDRYEGEFKEGEIHIKVRNKLIILLFIDSFNRQVVFEMMERYKG